MLELNQEPESKQLEPTAKQEAAKQVDVLSMCKTVTVDSIEIPVLTLDSPEKWLIASERRTSLVMKVPGTSKSLKIPMNGISLAAWEHIEIANPIPQWDSDDGEESVEYKQERRNVILDRNIAIIEAATPMKIKGNNQEDRRATLLSMPEGDTKVLMFFIRTNACNMDMDSEPGFLLQKYNEYLGKMSRQDEIESFEDWQKACQVTHVMRMQRKDDPYVIEIPMNGISASLNEQILEETKEPEPPLVPFRDALTGKLIPGRSTRNVNDKHYLKKIRAVTQLRVCRYLAACLTFEIPGQNEKEKFDWISQRLVGDVIQIRSFIENDIMGVASRHSFFSMS